MYSYFDTLFTLFKFDKKRVAFSLFLSVIQSITLVPIGLIIQHLLDNINQKANYKVFLFGLLLTISLILLNTIIVLYNKHISLTLIKYFISDKREKLLQKLINLNDFFFESEELDKIHSQIVHDTERIDNMASALLTQLLPATIIIIGLSGVLIYMNFTLFFLSIVFFPLIYFLGSRISHKVKLSIQVFHKDFDKFSAGVAFILKFYDLIKNSGAEQRELSKQKLVLESVQKSSTSVAWNITAYNTVQGNLIVIGSFLVLLLGALQVVNRQISVGSLISFYVILNITSSYLKTIITFTPVLLEGQNSITSLDTILGNENINSNPSNTFSFNESISFQDVGFSFGEREILLKINFDIKKHEVLGISGKSGSGKTTLIKLLLGLYPVKSGQILIDGKKIETINSREFRRQIGYLPQEPLFFNGTIYENLTYGLDDFAPAEVEFICRKCLIHDFIISLPLGYKTEIGNSGNKISGGQKQKLAIARALIRKPEILVLDEPDKNLDEKSILDIFSYVRQSKITTILITHDNILLSSFDKQLKL